jgi:hypothetical protein
MVTPHSFVSDRASGASWSLFVNLLYVAEEQPKPYSKGQRGNHYTGSNEVD